MVLPLLILFLLGIIDAGRLMWTLNQTEKAAQMGARMAVATDMIPNGLYTMDYSATLGQGANIPTDSTGFGSAKCQKPGSTVTCTCVSNCPTLTPIKSAAFDAIVTRMNKISPMILASNVTITYTNSGLGYAGDPNGADVSPLISVAIDGLSFKPLITQFFGISFALPVIDSTLTTEDGEGNVSN